LRNSYYALFQQRPLPAEGGMFKSHWFESVREFPRKDAQYCRYWDKAGTADDGAYTVGVLMAKSKDNVFYVVDVVRGQWSALQREQVIKQTAIEDRNLYGNNTVWVEQEPGSGGKESAESTIRNLAGFTIRAERVTGSKEARAEPYAAQAEAGNVKLIQGDWNQVYKSELAAFPFGMYADQVDASSGAFNKLVTAQPSIATVQVSGLYASRGRR
jgi:predicted phage terminase large subunit-like protein